MASSVYPLGTTVYVHEEKNIQLTAAGSARIFQSGLQDVSLNEARLLAAVRSGDIWLLPLPSFEFKVTVRLHGLLHTRSAREEFLGDIAAILGNAKLWSDIYFTVISQIHQTGSDGGQLNIVLRLQPRYDRVSVIRPTRLPSSLETLFSAGGNVQPPLGVLKASIKGIDISLDFLKTTPGLCPVGRFMNLREISAFDPCPISQMGNAFWPQQLNMDGSSVVQGSNTRLSDDDSWESLDDDSPFSSQNSGVSSTSTFSCHEPVETVIDRFASISLLDSGFRTIFSPNPTRTHPRIRSRAEPETTALMDLAPNVFNPRYRTDTSHRACFIPSIAKGIASLLSNTDSPLVKSKLQALEESFRERQGHWSGQGNTLSTPESKGLMKCLLWKTMQRGLHDTGAACKLTPLNTGIIPTDGDDISLLTSLGDEDDMPWSPSTPENVFDFDDELDGEEEDDILTDYDQYGDDDLFDEADLDILLSSPSTIPPDNDLSDVASHSSLIFQDLNTPLPHSNPADLILSPGMLSIQTSLPASPELGVHGMADMEMEILSSEMEMLDYSSPVDLAERIPCTEGDIDMLF